MSNRKILGLDYGSKRIGLAVSDPLGMIATPRGTLINEGKKRAVQELISLCEKEDVGKLVVGLPLHLDGGKGELAQQAEAFAKALQDQGLNVELWDERLTSAEAERTLIQAGTRREKRKQVIDKLAAQIMLQSYLEAHHEPL